MLPKNVPCNLLWNQNCQKIKIGNAGGNNGQHVKGGKGEKTMKRLRNMGCVSWKKKKNPLHWQEKWKIIGIIRIQPCMPVSACVHEKVDHTLTQSSDHPYPKNVLHLPDFMRVHIFFFLNLFHCHPLSSFLYSLYIILSLDHTKARFVSEQFTDLK